jgi:hypothetical protein
MTGHFDASTATDVVVVPGPEPVGEAMADALASLYGTNAWGATGAQPGWGGDKGVGWDGGPNAPQVDAFPEQNLPTAPGALSATGDGAAVPGMNRVKAALGRAGI